MLRARMADPDVAENPKTGRLEVLRGSGRRVHVAPQGVALEIISTGRGAGSKDELSEHSMCEHDSVPTPSKKREPRIEAVPLAWKPSEGDDRGALTKTQRKAALDLWALFDEYYLERAPKASRFGRRKQTRKLALDAVMPVIDDQRRNQVLLLDGKRGSGKTALLVSLIEQWRRQATGADIDDGFAEVSDEKGRVIPLALLDLRSLPKHTSVLVHVAGALRRIVEHLDIDQRPSSPGMSPPADDGSFAEASRLWTRFLSATAAMEINSGRRSATLDPESFAEELHESEQDRLDLGELFGKLVDRVIARFSERERITPVFVIAIDDADMNPARLEECFEVLESLKHPRVVFVLTGDSRLFLQGLKAQFLGELRGRLESVPVTEAELQRIRDLDHALNLARRYYEKLIPPSHRFELPSLPADVRVGLLAGRLETIEVTKGVSLKAVFELLPQFLGLCLPETLRKVADFRVKNESEPLLSILEQLVEEVCERHAGDESSDVLRRLMRVSSEHPTYYDDPKTSIDLGGLSFWRPSEEWRSLRLRTGTISVVGLPIVELKRYFEDAGLQDDSPSLPRDAAALAMLLSFTSPHLDRSGTSFRPVERNGIASPVTFSMTFAEDKVFRSRWPKPFPDETRTWKPFEFERLMAELHTQLDARHPPKNEAIEKQQLLLEHLALNYVRIANHLFDGALGDPPPVPLFPESEEGLEEAWRGVISACSTRSPYWSGVDLPRLAAPESGLSGAAAARLLSAWSETIEDPAAALKNAEQRREIHLQAEAEKLGISYLEVHARLNALTLRHPWIERTRSIPRAASERLEAALAKVPLIVEDPRATWLPKSAAGYLDSRVRGLLQQATSIEIEKVTRAIMINYGPQSNWLSVLFEAWKASRPRSADAMTQTDFTVTSRHSPTPYALARFTETPVASSIPELEFSLSQGALFELEDRPIVQAMFRVVFDYALDVTTNATDVIDWPLMKAYWRTGNQELRPWPAPGWSTHLDHQLMVNHWEAMCLGKEHSKDTVGVLARRYIAAQLSVFTSRAATEDSAAVVPAWPELFERVRAGYEAQVGTRGPRARIFRSWLHALHRFGWVSSALPLNESAAAYCAYLEVLLPEGSGGSWTFQGSFVPDTRGRSTASTYTLIHRTEISSHQHRRRHISELRERYEDQLPEQFAVPREREALVTKLRTRLEALVPDHSQLPLSEELQTLMRQTYSGDLRRLLQAMEESEDILDLWAVTDPSWRDAIRRRGDRVQFSRGFEYTPYDSTFAEFPMARGLLLQTHGGRIDINLNEDNLSTLLYYFLHDLTDDARVSGLLLDPIEWPFWVVEQTEPHRRKWSTVPAVQWSAFIDMSLQLRAWHEALDPRTALDGVEASSTLLRNFVAATAHIFRTRQPYTALTGSWGEVISAAHTALESAAPEHKRTRGYAAWVDEIPRLALPAVGLTDKHAADVLVCYCDITGQDPRPQLTLFGDVITEHPAARVAKSEGRDGLEATLDALRAEYELG